MRSASLFKQHIMHALIDAGYADEFFGDIFHQLFSANGGKAYVKVEYPEVHDVIEQIHRAGGLAVLAHPGEYDSYDLLESLSASRMIDGVEVWHPRNKEGDEQRFAEIAREYGLVMTGGTDFHGMYTKNPLPVGTCTAPDGQVELAYSATNSKIKNRRTNTWNIIIEQKERVQVRSLLIWTATRFVP